MKDLFKHSSVVALGYLPLGTAFGILFSETGYHYGYAILMSVLVYAGSAQLISVTLLLAGAPLITVFITIFLLNSRHFFYSLYALNPYKKMPLMQKLYSMFALTDETFSLLSTFPKERQNDTAFMFKLSLLNHFWWIFGSAIGAILGYSANLNVDGLEFSLTALFIVLLIDQYKAAKNIKPIIIAIISSIIVTILGWDKHFLIASISVGILLFCIERAYAKHNR